VEGLNFESGDGGSTGCSLSYHLWMTELEPELELQIRSPQRPLEPETLEKLRTGLGACHDVAFAHLPEVQVVGRQGQPELVLFVWLIPAAMRSLRSALNLVSETVARALPKDRYVDVVILNSAPELIREVERAGCLLVERDAGERQRALDAADEESQELNPTPKRPWWWPF